MADRENVSDDNRPIPTSDEDLDSMTDPDIINPTTTVGDDTGDDRDAKVHVDEIDAAWTDIFPYDEPYADQVDGIRSYIDALAEHDNMVMEGACGTGKTLIGLTAGLHLLRNRSQVIEEKGDTVPEYSRILVATSVKAQIKQFIEEMQTINAGYPGTNFKTVVMRGKTDMLAFSHTDHPPFDTYSATEKTDELQDNAYHLIKVGSEIPIQWPHDVSPPNWSRHDYDWSDPSEEALEAKEKHKVDPYRAKAVAKTLIRQADESDDVLTVKGVESPYSDRIPEAQDVADSSKLTNGTLPTDKQGQIDPFYIGFHAFIENENRLPFWFGDAPNSVMTGDEIFTNAVSAGVCPHLSMAHLMQFADVLIGNYYHVFDPKTRLLTDMKAGVLDEETICILDEAHNIEERMRDALSDSVGLHTFNHTRNDLKTALGYLTNQRQKLPASERERLEELSVPDREFQNAVSVARQTVEEIGLDEVNADSLNTAINTVDYLSDWLADRSDQHINNEFPDWKSKAEHNRSQLHDTEISLDDPESTEVDPLTTDLEASFGDGVWMNLWECCEAAELIIETIPTTDRVCKAPAVGDFFTRWERESRRSYFREITLEKQNNKTAIDAQYQWTKEWSPQYQLYNCLPTKELRAAFSELGSVLLMSATLEPIDQYIQTTGIGECIDPSKIDEKGERRELVLSESADPATYRDVKVEQYPLRFPPENRLSVTVTAPRYTSRNRGSQTTDRDRMTDTRRTYADIIKTTAAINGNVLIAMPSYSEARWAYNLLVNDPDFDKSDLYVDFSSSLEETTNKLESFFGQDNGTIFTSLQGTITEGVDYDADKLHCCMIVGVSLIPPIDRNLAVQEAYDHEFDGISGFDATNKIPGVRKSRQAMGRVIRGTDEKGIRILADERYASGKTHSYLSEQEQQEFKTVAPDRLNDALDSFAQNHPDTF